MNCENILFDLALCYGGRFSNVNDFCKTAVNQYNLETYSDIVRLLDSKDSFSLRQVTKSDALKTLIDNDIKHFSIEPYENVKGTNVSELLTEHVKKVILFYQSIGLDISEGDIHIYFCDSFPKPFDKNKGIALAPDDYDEMKFGIKKGIYFLKSNVSLYQSRLLIAHEILHHVCSKRQPELLARGLEEGLCELIGAYIANSMLFAKPIPENYIRLRRFKYANPNQKFKVYTDYLRLAYLLLKQVGMEGVVSIINSGRRALKSAETSLIHGETIYLPFQGKATVPQDLLCNLDKLLLGTIENEVLSPLAFYIVRNYSGERSISSFADTHGIDFVDCKSAFEEIQKRIYGCVVDGDIIQFSDLEQLQNNGNILYECNVEV